MVNLERRHQVLRVIILCTTILFCLMGVDELINQLSSLVLALIMALGWCGVVILIGHRLYDEQVKQDLRRAGRCIHCGYDLRATRERCPECGEVISLD